MKISDTIRDRICKLFVGSAFLGQTFTKLAPSSFSGGGNELLKCNFS